MYLTLFLFLLVSPGIAHYGHSFSNTSSFWDIRWDLEKEEDNLYLLFLAKQQEWMLFLLLFLVSIYDFGKMLHTGAIFGCGQKG